MVKIYLTTGVLLFTSLTVASAQVISSQTFSEPLSNKGRDLSSWSISGFNFVQKADCQSAINEYELILSKGGQNFLVKEVPDCETVGWVFFLSHLMDVLTQAQSPSISFLDPKFEPGVILVPLKKASEYTRLPVSAADMTDIFSIIDEATFCDTLNNILSQGFEEFACKVDREDLTLLSDAQVKVYQDRVNIALQLLENNGLEAVFKEAMAILRVMHPMAYEAFNKPDNQMKARSFIGNVRDWLSSWPKRSFSGVLNLIKGESKPLEDYLNSVFGVNSAAQCFELEQMALDVVLRFVSPHQSCFDSLLMHIQDPANAAFLANPPMSFVEGLVTNPHWLPLLGLLVSKGLSVETLKFSNNQTLLHRALAYRNYDAAEFLQRLLGGKGALYAETEEGFSVAYYPWFYGDFNKASSFGPCPLDTEIRRAMPMIVNDECADKNFKNRIRFEKIYWKILAAAEQVGFKLVPHEVEVMFNPLAEGAQVTPRGTLQISKKLLAISDEAIALMIAHELGHVLRDDGMINAAKESEALAENKRVADQYFNGFYDYPDGSIFFAEHAADSIGVLLAMHAGYDLSAYLEQSVFDEGKICLAVIMDPVIEGAQIDIHPYQAARDKYIAKLIKAHPHWLVK